MNKYVEGCISGILSGAIGALTYVLMTSKDRTWYVHEIDDCDLIAICSKHGIRPIYYNCGWGKAPDVECFTFKCSNKVYAKICEEVNAKGITILQDNVGY